MRVPGARRLFTVAQANEILPEVRSVLAELRSAVNALADLRQKLSVDGEVPRADPDTWVDPNHFRCVVLFHHSVNRFQEIGVEIKDVQKGLLDFPARLGEQEICLCWQDGEDVVGWYHDVESGFAGRKPIEELAGRELAPTVDEPGEDE